jgi:hypothetical protein
MTKPLRRKDQIDCPSCGKAKPRRSHRQTYCSTRCRQRANYEKLAVQRLFPGRRYPTSPRPTIGPKKQNDFKVLHGRKSRSSLTEMPVSREVWRAILDTEVFDRDWRPVTSSDGVMCEVSLLRPRSLKSPA